nr:DUF5683 domain-containing protein [Pedobacter sp. ASV2]
MQKGRLIILVSLFTFFLINVANAQVKDSVQKPVDTLNLKTKAVKPLGKDTVRKKSAKESYVNPGKIAGRKAVLKSLLLPGLGQVYNIQLLSDGYGERAGKSQTLQKVYTIGKIAAIYTGFTVLTLSYIDNSNNYKIFLAEAQYREARLQGATNLVGNPALARYSNEGILTAKSTYKRNKQIVLFSYGLIYFANVVDAYVAARLHFFNIDDKLTFKITPTVINNNSMYSFNPATPALKLSLTF